MTLKAIREVSTSAGLRIYVLPGAGICLLAPPNGGGGCSGSLALALSQGIGQYATLPDGHRLVVGVVPRTNTEISVTTTAGRTHTIPVVDGLFITPAAGIATIRIRGATGRITASRVLR
jgi:hypothetical protein